MVGVILAGGENRRMPVTKAFLRIGGTTFIDRLLALHRSLADRVLLVTRNPGLYAGFDVELVGDILPYRGPATGLLSALGNFAGDRALVTACDMPFLQRRWLERIVTESAGYDVTVPWGPEGPEPLCAVYTAVVAGPLEREILAGRRSLRSFIEGYDPARVRRMDLDMLGMNRETFERTFVSVNTPRDFSHLVGGNI